MTDDRLQILIIDDDVLLARTLGDMLWQSGYTIDTAHSGEDGLQKIRDKNPQLVILDYIMPGMSGLDVLKEMRANEFSAKTEVIFATNNYDTMVINTVLALNVHDYILKADISLEQIAQRVGKYIPPTKT